MGKLSTRGYWERMELAAVLVMMVMFGPYEEEEDDWKGFSGMRGDQEEARMELTDDDDGAIGSASEAGEVEPGGDS